MLEKRIQAIVVVGLMSWCVSVFAQGIVPDENPKGKWGYVNDAGEKVIDYKYDQAEPFSGGLALVKKGDEFGMIDVSGNTVVPIKYNIIEKYNEQVYKVAAGGKIKDGVLMDEKYGFVNKDGKEILKPEYDEVGAFINGLAYVLKGDLYGYIDTEIHIIVPVKYKAVGMFNSDGLVWVNEGGKFEKSTPTKVSGGKYGIYDHKGNVIVPVQYKLVGTFFPYEQKLNDDKLKKMGVQVRTVLKESGSHRLLVKRMVPRGKFSKLPDGAYGLWASNKADGTKNAVISKNGEVLIPVNRYLQAFYPEEGMAMVKPKTTFEYNFLDMSSGKMVFDKPLRNAWSYQDGLAVIQDTQWFLVDKSGKKVSAGYKGIYPRKDGVYITESANGFGALSSDGKEIIVSDKKYLFPPSHGLMLCSEGDNIGYVDTSGDWVIEPKYYWGQSFNFGYASVQNHDKLWGEITPQGDEAVPLKWKNTTNKTHSNMTHIWVSDNGSTYLPFDLSARRLSFEGKGYYWIRNFGRDFDGVAIAGYDKEHIGVVAPDGKVIVPTLFNYQEARNAYEKMLSSGKKEWEKIDTYHIKLFNNNARNRCNIKDTLQSDLWDF